jgi:hypothetical protein
LDAAAGFELIGTFESIIVVKTVESIFIVIAFRFFDVFGTVVGGSDVRHANVSVCAAI